MSASAQPGRISDVTTQANATVRSRGVVHRLFLLVNTLRHLRARQWLYLPLRRVLPDVASRVNSTIDEVSAPIFLHDALLAVPHRCVVENHLEFLNVRANFSVDAIDWHSATQTRLWRYNLHYFEYLADLTLDPAQRAALIDSWIVGNCNVRGEGWEAYPLSLRIINWVKYFDHLLRNGQSLPPRWLQSLHQQSEWLWSHREFHIDANHLLKNGFALFLSAALLRTCHAQGEARYLAAASQLAQLLDEQFNDDGGHYERSPMYHRLCLHLCIDACNVLMSFGATEKKHSDLEQQLLAIVSRGLAFARCLQHNDEQIMLFNDSVNGIAPVLPELEHYARALHPALVITHLPHGSFWFAQSGFFGFRDERIHLVVNAGDAQPAYQPGHAHADCLAFELSLDEQPVFVNAGNDCYENTSQRAYARSTAAHNTVQIDGVDQSEMWSIFRVGRRARVTAVAPQVMGKSVFFTATHDGYRRIQSTLAHRRDVLIKPGLIEFCDHVSGVGEHRLAAYLHLHPDCRARKLDHRRVAIERGGDCIAQLTVDTRAVKIAIEPTDYYPQFGMRQTRDSIVLRCVAVLPQTLTYYLHISPDSRSVA